MRRREFITLLGGVAGTWSVAALAQRQPALPVVGFVTARSAETSLRSAAAFRKGLSEAGYVDGQNVTVEYHWLDGRYELLSSLMADLVRRGVAVIATPASNPTTLAAKAATTTIPIVFGVSADPVKLGLVASVARPGGNATGINFFLADIAAKRLGLLHDLPHQERSATTYFEWLFLQPIENPLPKLAPRVSGKRTREPDQPLYD